jgi:hypothetical protein
MPDRGKHGRLVDRRGGGMEMPAGGEIIILYAARLCCRLSGLPLPDRRDFLHFDVNPNSGQPESKAGHPCTAENRVFVDSQGASHVLLLIIP